MNIKSFKKPAKYLPILLMLQSAPLMAEDDSCGHGKVKSVFSEDEGSLFVDLFDFHLETDLVTGKDRVRRSCTYNFDLEIPAGKKLVHTSSTVSYISKMEKDDQGYFSYRLRQVGKSSEGFTHDLEVLVGKNEVVFPNNGTFGNCESESLEMELKLNGILRTFDDSESMSDLKRDPSVSFLLFHGSFELEDCASKEEPAPLPEEPLPESDS